MKKTFRQEDGSFVTIEGTADEIRQYERIVESDRRGNEPKKQGPDVLKGEEASDALKELLEKLGNPRPVQPTFVPWTPSWCIKCGGQPCVCYLTYPPWPTYPQIWYKTVAGNVITVSGDSTLPVNTYDGFDGPGMY
jgi:hypothetical protein